MIECTNCERGRFILSVKNMLICDECGSEVSINDNLIAFHLRSSGSHNGMSECILDDVVQAEDKHFWMKSRRKYIKQIFDRFVRPDDVIIEIGAGTGDMASSLLNNCFKNFSVGDVHLKALEYARRYGVNNRYQFDLTKTPFVEHFDVVCAFDVLEHMDDEDLALRNIYKMLKKEGRVIVTVPAYMWLWSRQDAIASHRRRYDLKRLISIFKANNFRIIWTSYFFLSLLPCLLLRRIIDRDRGFLKGEDFVNRFKINSVLNLILEKLLSFEIALLKNSSLRFGSSIILIGQKL